MAGRNWAYITDGGVFEGLSQTLVFFEDPKAKLFGREGKDGGQDILSGDGTLVFQAKHHDRPTPALAIADAKREALKIEEYKNTSHPNSAIWNGVTRWRLVTNASFNSNDNATWNSKVVPVFKILGLDADFWEQANLDALLDRHPEVDRCYFGGQTRVFLTLPEARERLLRSEPFLSRNTLAKFVGRDAQQAAVGTFLDSSKLFLVVHAAGGIGKTRFLFEVGESIASVGTWQVFWANVESMTESTAWLAAIQPERKTLLLVDEPDNPRIIRLLAEQLGGRTASWKVAIAVRSPKDPILDELHSPRMQRSVQELPLDPLSMSAAEEMCRDLIDSGPLRSQSEAWRSNAAKQLAKAFDRHPVWITLAIHLLELHGDLSRIPETAEKLAQSYAQEMMAQQEEFAREKVESLLRWVALLGTVNRESSSAVALLAEKAGFDDKVSALRAIHKLVVRRALAQRGANNRLVEIKPDVVRDYILKSWLVVDTGQPSGLLPSSETKILVTEALANLIKGDIGDVGSMALRGMARTEMLLKLSGYPVPILDPFYRSLAEQLREIKAPERVSIVKDLAALADVRPIDTVAVSRELRISEAEPIIVHTRYRDMHYSQEDIVLELAWTIFHAAHGARTFDERQEVLEELMAIAAAETHLSLKKPLPSDGKRAPQLIGRVIAGGPEFFSDFYDAANKLGHKILDKLRSESPSTDAIPAIRALLQAAISLERSQNWSEGWIVHSRRFAIPKTHPAWESRKTLLDKIKTLLASTTTPSESRLILWRLLYESHRSANHSYIRNEKSSGSYIRDEILENLEWALPVVQQRAALFKELKAARSIWKWHVENDKDDALKSAAARLEQVYLSHPLASEFELLTKFDADLRAVEQRTLAKAKQLAESKEPRAIFEFVDRSLAFLEDERGSQGMNILAMAIGNLAKESESVRQFIREALVGNTAQIYRNFAISAATSWIYQTRLEVSAAAASQLVKKLLGGIDGIATKIVFVRSIYGSPITASFLDRITPEEYKSIRSLGSMFLANDAGPTFLGVVGWTFAYDWPGFKSLVEGTLDDIPESQLPQALDALIDAIHTGFRALQGADLPSELGTWIFLQVVRAPDTDQLDAMLHWHLEEILNATGRLSIPRLLEAILSKTIEPPSPSRERRRVLGGHPRLSTYAFPINPSQVGDPLLIDALGSLVELGVSDPVAAIYIPDYLHDLDAGGLVVPEVVAEMIEKSNDPDRVRTLANIASSYPLGAGAWRTAAKPAIRFAQTFDERIRASIFFALSQKPLGMMWSANPGQVPDLFKNKRELAQKLLESETDSEFAPFWKWNLEVAEADYEFEAQRAKEDRGE